MNKQKVKKNKNYYTFSVNKSLLWFLHKCMCMHGYIHPQTERTGCQKDLALKQHFFKIRDATF